MSNLLSAPWSTIIPLIPVRDHFENIKSDIWRPHFAAHGLAKYHAAIFGTSPSVAISRSRLLTYPYANPVQKCLEIFLWGYPPGGRGHLKDSYLQNISQITRLASLSIQWPDYFQNLNQVGHLGISTISKLAYFHGCTFGGQPALILDSRLIDVLAGGRWGTMSMPGLSYTNAASRYPDYLRLINTTATSLGCRPDNIEFFLFGWGDTF
jgi:hypothetical protein